MAIKKDKKQNRFFTYVLAFFAVLVVAAVMTWGLNRPSTNTTAPGNVSNVPGYVLSAPEEAEIKKFVANFVSLYNSYRSENYTNLTALGDYQTESMQQKTAQTISYLEANVPEGLVVRAEALEDTFSYQYPEANRLLVSMRINVQETSTVTGKSASYEIVANVVLLNIGDQWVVDNLETKRNE